MASIRQIVQDVLYEARGCSAHGLCLRSNRHFLGCTRYVSYCFCFFRYRFSLLSAGPDSFSCTSDRHGRRSPTLHRKGPVGRLQSSSDGSGFPVCGASRPHEHGFRSNRLLSLRLPGGLVQHFEDLYWRIGLTTSQEYSLPAGIRSFSALRSVRMLPSDMVFQMRPCRSVAV